MSSRGMGGGKDKDAPPQPDEQESGEGAEESEDTEGTEFDEPSDEEKRDRSRRVTRAELRAFVGRPTTYARARTIIGQKLQGQDVDDLVGEAIAEALETKDENLPRAASIQAWFDRICRRRAAKRDAKLQRRKKHEEPMPPVVAPAVVDEAAGESPADPGDAMADRDPRVEARPIATDWRAEGSRFRSWMRDQVRSDPRDRETWAIAEELADGLLAADDEGEKLSYKKLAERHGMTEAQLYKRLERLREKYRRRYEERRNGVVAALLRWGAAAVVGGVAIAWVVWRLLHPAPPAADIGPDTPASASAAPAHDG
jgi:DNA-directed RNA polymerase specialized sigma24 family protein